MIASCIIIIIALFFSAFFSAAETAYNFANRNHLRIEAEEGKKSYRLAYKISLNYDKALTTILVGNNIANFALSACATIVFVELLVNYNSLTNDSVAALIATVVTTIITLIFGEIIPKTAASVNGDGFAAFVAFPLKFMMIILSPITLIINLITKTTTDRIDEEDDDTSAKELSSIIEAGDAEGSIDEGRSELLQSTIDFIDTTIKEVMLSRLDAVMVDINDDKEAIINTAISSEFSRIPVYNDSIDNIIGILHVNILLKDLLTKTIDEIDLNDYIKDALFLYESVKLPDALDELRNTKHHMAIVLDEFGATFGIVTMEDILEELVGDIWDEDEDASFDIEENKYNEYTVQGDMSISDFTEYFNLESDELDTESVTVAGWAIEMLDGFPEKKASFHYKNLIVEISKMEDKRILELKVTINPYYVEEEKEKSFFEKI